MFVSKNLTFHFLFKLCRESVRLYLACVYLYCCILLVAPEVLSNSTTTTTSSILINNSSKGKFSPEAKPLESLPNPLHPNSDNPRFKGPSSGARPTTAKPSIVVTEEDKKARKDFGGNCTNHHWLICSNQTFFGKDVFDKVTHKKIASKMRCNDTEEFPPVCMYNGWTVTRCHIFCMAKHCNRDLKINYEKYVSKDGFC